MWIYKAHNVNMQAESEVPRKKFLIALLIALICISTLKMVAAILDQNTHA